MASEITSLLQHGWKNLWKNRAIWLFSSLTLIEPLIRLVVPIQKITDLPSSLLNLVVSLASVYFTFMSIAGVSFVAHCIATGWIVDFRTAFEESKDLFWRVVAFSFLLLIFIAPFACIVAFSLWEFLQIKDIYHNLFFASIPLSVFAAMGYFPITETITSNSKIGKSLKAAWTVFTYHFFDLAITGLLLMVGLRAIIISISLASMLIQNNFDVSAFGKLDFISPQLSFPNNNLYKLIIAIPQAIWQTYTASIFMFAYLKYSGAKMSKQSTP